MWREGGGLPRRTPSSAGSLPPPGEHLRLLEEERSEAPRQYRRQKPGQHDGEPEAERARVAKVAGNLAPGRRATAPDAADCGPVSNARLREGAT